jgi:hypothetical protein
MINDIKKIGVGDALISLRPGAQWVLNGTSYSDLVWMDENQTKPSELEVITEVDRLQIEWNNNLYQRQRAVNYPSIGDQLDMLWHAIDSGTLDTSSDFYTAIKAVKDTNPKS